MDINQLKKQVLVNRKLLANLYENLSFYKREKVNADWSGNEPVEFMCHNNLKRVRKEIKGLVELQKALKADVQEQLNWDRTIRAMQRVVDEGEESVFE